MKRKPGSSGKVLHIEDDQSDADLLQLHAQVNGFDILRIDTLGKLEEAVISYKPDLIVSDYNLPDTRSRPESVLGALRAQNVPSIVLTGHPDDEVADRIRAMGRGIMDYQIKPHHKHEYKSLILAMARDIRRDYQPFLTGRNKVDVLAGAEDVRDDSPDELSAIVDAASLKLIEQPYKVIDGIYVLTHDKDPQLHLKDFKATGYPVIPLSNSRLIEQYAGKIHPALIIYDNSYPLTKAEAYFLESVYPYAAFLRIGKYQGLGNVRMINGATRARVQTTKEAEGKIPDLLLAREERIEDLWQHQPNLFQFIGAHASGKSWTTWGFLSSHPLAGYCPSAVPIDLRQPRPGERSGVHHFWLRSKRMEEVKQKEALFWYKDCGVDYAIIYDHVFDAMLEKLDVAINTKGPTSIPIFDETINPDRSLTSPKKIYIFREEEEITAAAMARDQKVPDSLAKKLDQFKIYAPSCDHFVYNLTLPDAFKRAAMNVPSMSFLGSLPFLSSKGVGDFIRTEREKSPVRPNPAYESKRASRQNPYKVSC